MKTSQTAWVKAQLLTHKRISRNQALRRFISRLAARIADLREAGWNIEGEWKKTRNGRDYIYRLIKN